MKKEIDAPFIPNLKRKAKNPHALDYGKWSFLYSSY
jgi:hypothetical protein